MQGTECFVLHTWYLYTYYRMITVLVRNTVLGRSRVLGRIRSFVFNRAEKLWQIQSKEVS
jgi:hypothetical protein